MAVEVARHFNTAIRWTFKMEMDMVAVKRLLAYADLESESDPLKAYSSTKFEGRIEFKNVEMRYQEHLEPAI